MSAELAPDMSSSSMTHEVPVEVQRTRALEVFPRRDVRKINGEDLAMLFLGCGTAGAKVDFDIELLEAQQPQRSQSSAQQKRARHVQKSRQVQSIEVKFRPMHGKVQSIQSQRTEASSTQGDPQDRQVCKRQKQVQSSPRCESGEGTAHDLLGLLDGSPGAPPSNGALGRLRSFWSFVADAILGEKSEDTVCSIFELGGSIDALGDVAFTRDEITAPLLRHNDLRST